MLALRHLGWVRVSPVSAVWPSVSAMLASMRLCAALGFLCMTLAGSASHSLAFVLLETTFVTSGQRFSAAVAQLD